MDIVPAIPRKCCTKCGVEYPATTDYFGKQKNGKYGVRADCKTCANAKNRAYREANPETAIAWRDANRERINAQNREWKRVNAERHAEINKAYYAENREHHNAVVRDWYQVNRERVFLLHKAWHKENPEKSRQYNNQRRARKAGSLENFTPADLELQYKSQRGKCWHCGIELNNEYHADHLIPLAQGGSNAPDNIVCACATCNLSKGAKTVAQWKGRLF